MVPSETKHVQSEKCINTRKPCSIIELALHTTQLFGGYYITGIERAVLYKTETFNLYTAISKIIWISYLQSISQQCFVIQIINRCVIGLTLF